MLYTRGKIKIDNLSERQILYAVDAVKFYNYAATAGVGFGEDYDAIMDEALSLTDTQLKVAEAMGALGALSSPFDFCYYSGEGLNFSPAKEWKNRWKAPASGLLRLLSLAWQHAGMASNMADAAAWELVGKYNNPPKGKWGAYTYGYHSVDRELGLKFAEFFSEISISNEKQRMVYMAERSAGIYWLIGRLSESDTFTGRELGVFEGSDFVIIYEEESFNPEFGAAFASGLLDDLNIDRYITFSYVDLDDQEIPGDTYGGLAIVNRHSYVLLEGIFEEAVITSDSGNSILEKVDQGLELRSAHYPWECPVCKKENINGGSISNEGWAYFQDMYCEECGHEWTNMAPILLQGVKND